MVALFVTRRLSAIASTNLPTILLRSQPCTLESIRRRHGMLLQLSRLAVTSARFATSRMQSTGSQPVKHPISNFVGSWRIQHRSSSTNGPGKSPDVKTKTGESIPTQTTKMKTENPLPEGESPMTMWQKFLAPKPMPERYSASWYREVLLICTVFAITGSTTMVVRILIERNLFKRNYSVPKTLSFPYLTIASRLSALQ